MIAKPSVQFLDLYVGVWKTVAQEEMVPSVEQDPQSLHLTELIRPTEPTTRFAGDLSLHGSDKGPVCSVFFWFPAPFGTQGCANLLIWGGEISMPVYD